MVDFSLDEKVGGALLVLGGLALTALNYLSLDIVNPETSTYILILVPLLVIASGIYVYFRQPGNNIPFIIASSLLFGLSVITIFGLGMSGSVALIERVLVFTGLGTGVISFGASLVDIAEEFL
jgi:hypothetical protein